MDSIWRFGIILGNLIFVVVLIIFGSLCLGFDRVFEIKKKKYFFRNRG